jgi:hypothetical protein
MKPNHVNSSIYFTYMYIALNRIGSVMVSMLYSSVVNRGFKI